MGYASHDRQGASSTEGGVRARIILRQLAIAQAATPTPSRSKASWIYGPQTGNAKWTSPAKRSHRQRARDAVHRTRSTRVGHLTIRKSAIIASDQVPARSGVRAPASKTARRYHRYHPLRQRAPQLGARIVKVKPALEQPEQILRDYAIPTGLASRIKLEDALRQAPSSSRAVSKDADDEVPAGGLTSWANPDPEILSGIYGGLNRRGATRGPRDIAGVPWRRPGARPNWRRDTAVSEQADPAQCRHGTNILADRGRYGYFCTPGTVGLTTRG